MATHLEFADGMQAWIKSGLSMEEPWITDKKGQAVIVRDYLICTEVMDRESMAILVRLKNERLSATDERFPFDPNVVSLIEHQEHGFDREDLFNVA